MRPAEPAPSAPQDIEDGNLFPAFSNIHVVSARIMARVANFLVRAGLGTKPDGVSSLAEWQAYCVREMWSMDDAYALSASGLASCSMDEIAWPADKK